MNHIFKTIGFPSFLSVGARAQISFFLPDFDVIEAKEAEMEQHVLEMAKQFYSLYSFLESWSFCSF